MFRCFFYLTLMMVVALFQGVDAGDDVQVSGKSRSRGHGDDVESDLNTGKVAHLSIIALGAVPARRYGAPEGGGPHSKKKEAVLLPPLQGSVPPAVLYFQSERVAPVAGEDGGEENDVDAQKGWTNGVKISVGFNRGAPVVQVPAEVPLALSIRKRQTEDRNEIHSKNRHNPEKSSSKDLPYIKLPALSSDAQVLCFLSHPIAMGRGKTPWSTSPKVSLLNIKSKALFDKNLLIRNFSSHPVALITGKENAIVLGAGKRRSYRLDSSLPYHRISAKEKRKKRLIINTSLRVPDDALTVIVFYDIEPKTKRSQSIGVFRATVMRVFEK